jgi:hypothetical protein
MNILNAGPSVDAAITAISIASHAKTIDDMVKPGKILSRMTVTVKGYY